MGARQKRQGLPWVVVRAFRWEDGCPLENARQRGKARHPRGGSDDAATAGGGAWIATTRIPDGGALSATAASVAAAHAPCEAFATCGRIVL